MPKAQAGEAPSTDAKRIMGSMFPQAGGKIGVQREPASRNVKAMTLALFEYCRKHEWAGHDPYDALNSELFSKLKFLDSRLPRLVFTQVLKRIPWNPRPLLLIPGTQNPKALALFLASLIKLSRLGLLAEPQLLGALGDRIVALRSQDTPYWCWGYSFPWQTRTTLVPRGAPNLVCTVFVTNALLDLYEYSGDHSCLAVAISAAEYIMNELYWTDGDSIASLAYPLATSRTTVHNANLLGAALLCRVAKHSGDKKYVDPAMKVARHSAAMQRSNGAWLYGDADTQAWVDNFHTGYNLSALRSIGRDAETDEFDSRVQIGFAFYRKHFFREDGAARYFHDRTYPIDIHCIAQSILTLVEFKHLSEDNIQLAGSVLDWAATNMLAEEGYFFYRALRFGRIKTSYMRWSQAWMLLALTTLLEALDHQVQVQSRPIGVLQTIGGEPSR